MIGICHWNVLSSTTADITMHSVEKYGPVYHCIDMGYKCFRLMTNLVLLIQIIITIKEDKSEP